MLKRNRPHPGRRKKTGTSLRKYFGRGLLLGTIVFVLYIFLFGDYGAYRIWKQKKEIARLEQTIEALRLKQEELKTVADLLENDPEYIEKVAREEYGMIKQGEIIYQIVPAPEGESSEKSEGDDESPDEKRPGDF